MSTSSKEIDLKDSDSDPAFIEERISLPDKDVILTRPLGTWCPIGPKPTKVWMPDTEEVALSRQPSKPSIISMFINRFFPPRPVAIGGSAFLASSAMLAACSPAPQQIIETSDRELERGGITVKEQIQIPQDLIEQINTKVNAPFKLIDVKAVDPLDATKTARLSVVQTSKEGIKKEYLLFRNRENQLIFAEYETFDSIDQDGSVHISYKTKDRQQTFLDYTLYMQFPKKHGEAEEQYQQRLTTILNNPDTEEKIRESFSDVNKIVSVAVSNPYFNESATINSKDRPLADILDLFQHKKARAAEITATPTATATKAPEPIPTPKPKAGYEVKENSIVYRAEKGEVLNVPQVPGLKAELKEIDGQKKIIYTAEKGNKYGLKEGERAGSFHPNVSIVKEGVAVVTDAEKDTNLVGGVELRSEVAGLLMEEALAKFEKQEDRYILPIPIDISDIKDQDQVLLAKAQAIARSGSYNFVVIQAPAGKPITNPFLGAGKGVDIIPSVQKDALMMPLENSYLDSDKIARGKEMYYAKIEVSRVAVKQPQTSKNVSFGDKVRYEDSLIFETSMQKHGIDSVTPLSVKGGFWNVLLWLGAYQERRVMDFNHVLAIENPNGTASPVFLSANK